MLERNNNVGGWKIFTDLAQRSALNRAASFVKFSPVAVAVKVPQILSEGNSWKGVGRRWCALLSHTSSLHSIVL